MYDSDQLSLGDSTADEMSQLSSQSQEGPPPCPPSRDPSANDPTFSSEEEMKAYLSEIGHKDIYLSPENVEIDTFEERKLNCDCGKCTGLKMSNQQEYLCCNQLFTWKDIFVEEVKNCLV